MIKRTIIAVFVFCLTFCSLTRTPPSKANASIQYAMIIEEDAALYSDASCRYVKFYLPYSYFVKIIEIGTDFSRVTYMSDQDNCPSCDGYVKNINLDFSFDNPQNPYPIVSVNAISDEVLFSDLTNKKPKEVIATSNKAIFYGSITYEGEKYLYVYSQNQIGYVRENGFTPLVLENHPLAPKETPIVEKPTTQSSSTEKKNGSIFSDASYRPAIIILIILSALFLLYFILKQNPQKAEQSFYRDEDDF